MTLPRQGTPKAGVVVTTTVLVSMDGNCVIQVLDKVSEPLENACRNANSWRNDATGYSYGE